MLCIKDWKAFFHSTVSCLVSFWLFNPKRLPIHYYYKCIIQERRVTLDRQQFFHLMVDALMMKALLSMTWIIINFEGETLSPFQDSYTIWAWRCFNLIVWKIKIPKQKCNLSPATWLKKHCFAAPFQQKAAQNSQQIFFHVLLLQLILH